MNAEKINDLQNLINELTDQLKKQSTIQHFEIILKKEWGSNTPHSRKNIRNHIHANYSGASDILNLETLPKIKDGSLSISHTKDYGGYAVSKNTSQLGFDLETKYRIEMPLLKRVSTEKEISEAPDPILLWSAKEAAFKAIQPPLKTLMELFIHEWTLLTENTYQFKASIRPSSPSAKTTPGTTTGLIISNTHFTMAIVFLKL